MRDNIAYAVFENSSKAVTNALWQYDYGQALQISGVELPGSFEVHFCNRGNNSTITQIGQNSQVSIPDEFLTNPTWIDAYIFLHSGLNDGETVYLISIPVSARPMPTDDEPTPEEQSAITQAIAALNAGVDAAEQSATESAESAAAALESEQAAKASEDAAALSERNAEVSATAAANSASASAASASASADSALKSAASASASAASAADSYQDAERAEQAANNAGYLDIEIVDGNLIYTRTDAVDVDFVLDNGHLIMEVI